MKEYWNDPELRTKWSNYFIEKWKEPEYREKTLKMLKSEERRSKLSKTKTQQWANPEYKSKCLKTILEANKKHERNDKISQSLKERWKDPEYKKKMSDMSIEMWAEPSFKESMSGENSATWKGGISFEPYPPDFNNELKRRIRERDNYICGICGERDAKWIHHINYDKMNSCPTNLITLHNSCQTKTNYEREAWEEFFTFIPLAMIF